MLGLRLVCRPVCSGVAAGRRLVVRPLGRCLRVCARAPSVAPLPFRSFGMGRSRWGVRAMSGGPEDVVESSPGLIGNLKRELSQLDEAVVEWEERLMLSQGQQEQDMRLLLELAENVKAEQQAWQCEIDEMEELMKNTTSLELSNQEIGMMQERSAVLKRKVQLFKGLLKERDREIECLRTQLEDIHQMGELKRIKEWRAVSQEAVMTGVAVSSELGAATAFPGERSSPSMPTPFLWGDTPVSDASFWAPIPDVDSLVPRSNASPDETFKGQSTISKKLETPGLLLLSVAMMISEVGANVWQAVEQLVPEKYHMLVRVVGVSAASMLLASAVSLRF